ncbi:MAG TPA: TonB-dependent receptor plug domain-containing protein, partial [Sphingobacteriaceae bacterium]|nr:TonB-dependent receptor plug domain-containing protein [Sphingobacteriaceae bacterium]
MHTKFKVYFLLFLLLLPLFNVAQTSGSLLRIRFSDGDPAIAASIYLSRSGTELLLLSDHQGEVSLKNLSPGRYEVRVTMVGIEPQTFDLNLQAGQRMYDFVLQIKPAQWIEEVHVAASSEKERIETKGFAVNVVETQKSALQTLQTNELLDRSAGVRIRQDGGLGSRIQYNINGMTGNAVKIFIDGIPSTNFGPSFSLNSIPPVLIDRIEIYKGVVPAYLSDDALGGAINIITKHHNQNSWSTSYSIGSFNTHQAALNGAYRAQSGFFSDFSAFYNYSDNDYSVWGEEITFRDYQGAVIANQKARRFHDAFESYGAKFELGWSGVKWADRFSIGAVFSQDYKEIQNGVTMQRVFGDRHSRRQGQVASLTYSKDKLFVEGLSLQWHAQYSWLHAQVIDTVGMMYDWRGPILYPDGNPVRYTGGAELGNRQTAAIHSDQSFVVRTN